VDKPRSGVFRVLVLGGYGNFGRPIVERVARLDGVLTIVAGRRLEQARACAAQVGAEAAVLDLNDPGFQTQIASLQPDLVISTAGPFQGQDYRVARAAIAAGSHYVDLADGRGFVCGIGALDAEAKSRNVLVVSGASSVPALSAAVVDHYAPHFRRLHSICHGISTSERVPGGATVAALLSYCGKPLRIWQLGAWRFAHGWQHLIRRRFEPGIGVRWLARCDVPDLELFPARYRGVDSVDFYAGVESVFIQGGLWLLAWAVRLGVIDNAASLSRSLRYVGVAMERFGSGRSAMFVELTGISKEGTPQTRVWELHAENNDGPNIPCMAAVALARGLAAGEISVRGAMPCVGLITLQEYLAELEGLAVWVRRSDAH